jgi:hypothetical protein
MTHQGGLKSYSRGWEGCRGQVEVVERLLRGVVWPVGGRCIARVKGEGARGVWVGGDGRDHGDGDEGKGRRGPAGLDGVEKIGLAVHGVLRERFDVVV